MLAKNFAVVVAVLVICAAAQRPARAQTRLVSTAIPDVAFWAAGGPHALDWQLGGGLAQIPGSDGVPLLGFAALRWGKRFGRRAQLRWASTMDLARSTRGPNDETRPALLGRHRLAAEASLGGRRAGVDLSVDGWLSQAWGKRAALSAIDIGPGSYTRAGLRVGVAPFYQPRKHRRSGFISRVPIRYELDQLAYHDTSSRFVRGVRHALSVGLGPVGFNRNLLHGSLEIVGVTVAQTVLQPRAGSTDLAPTMDVVEVRISDIDAAFHVAGMTLATRFKLGAGAVALDGRDAVELFTMSYGFQLRGKEAFAGLGLSEAPALSPSGQEVLSTWRAELLAGWTAKQHGGELRLIGEWSSDAYDDARDSIQRYGIHSEVYRRVGDNLELGAYSVASHEAGVTERSMDLWQARPTWATELGVFLRLRGSH